MSKTSFTITLILLAVAATAGAFWFFSLYGGAPVIEELEPTDNFLPFGESPDAGAPSKDGTVRPPSGEPSDSGKKKIRVLSRTPVSGFTIINNASTTLVRYVERATGHIYEIAANESAGKRITNTTIPRVGEAIFASGGDTVLLRYLNDNGTTIETYSAKIPQGGIEGSEGGELKGVFLPRGIGTISVSPDGKKIFYIEKFSNGSVGFVSGTQNENKTQIFNSYMTEWLPSWPEEKTIVLTTKPSRGIMGWSYGLTVATKKLGDLMASPGLASFMSPDGKFILFGSSADNALSLGIYNIKEKTTLFFDNRTLPEKCVWANGSAKIYCAVPRSLPDEPLPDSWYQGAISFSDRIWLIDPERGLGTIITDLERDTLGMVDAVRLSVSKNSEYLIFINKSDGSLWSIELP
ncbi:MAG: hypothetical protein AAB355_02290 [Patescibacteria group bacterium]